MSIRKTCAVLLTIVTGLTGCTRAPSPESLASKRPVTTEQTAALTAPAHRSPGKPTAAVDISFAATGDSLPGGTLSIAIAVKPTSHVDQLRVDITGIDGLSIVGGPKTLRLNIASGDTHIERVTVGPLNEGGVLVVTAMTTADGVEEHKVVTFPIELKGVSPALAKPVDVTPTGEKIISHRAEETTTPN